MSFAARTRSSVSVLVLLTSAAPAFAAPGTLSVTWGDACTPIVQDATATTAPLRLIFSVLGNDETVTGYRLTFVLSDENRTVPDAWEFEAEGCQGSSFLSIFEIPQGALSETCPSFLQGTSAVAIKNYSPVPPEWGLATTQRRAVLIHGQTKPEGVTSDSGTRYFLGEFRFDHLQSVAGPGVPGVTCGGLETPMCVWVLRDPGPLAGGTTYFRVGDGAEIPFDFPFDMDAITVNGMQGCPDVPVTPTTWGAIKSQYRR